MINQNLKSIIVLRNVAIKFDYRTFEAPHLKLFSSKMPSKSPLFCFFNAVPSPQIPCLEVTAMEMTVFLSRHYFPLSYVWTKVHFNEIKTF